MTPIDRDLAYCLTAALRYQLPRRTYGSGIVASVVRRHIPQLADESLVVMERDLGEAFRDGDTGDECDTREWRSLHRDISDAQDGTLAERLDAIERAAEAVRSLERDANKDRRRTTWCRWAEGFTPRQARHVATHTTHAVRAALCRQHGVPNTGRQWRMLRKRNARQGRPA